MKKICLLLFFFLNLLPVIENGEFAFGVGQLKAQMYGAEYACDDGGIVYSNVDCDGGGCVTACSSVS